MFYHIPGCTIFVNFIQALLGNFKSNESNWITTTWDVRNTGCFKKRVHWHYCNFREKISPYVLKEYMSFKYQNITFSINYNGVGSVSFLCVRICYKNYKFVSRFYKKQHSIEILLIKKISSQLTKKENSENHK